MLREKEWLDASIRRWERVRELVDKRLKLYIDLRTQLDADWADLKRIMDEDASVSSMMRVADVSETSGDVRVNLDAKTDALRIGSVDEVINKQTVNSVAPAEVVMQREARSLGNDSENDSRQVRGERNPNRLLILDLTSEQALTVTGLQKELAARGRNLSKQSIDNWVKRLLEQGLLVREPAPNSVSKFQYRRSSKPDVLEQVA